MIMLSAINAESFAEKKRMCSKTYSSFMGPAMVMGFSYGTYKNKLPEIRYYCKDTDPYTYNSFVNAMNKRPHNTSPAMKRVYSKFNNHNPTCINSWKKIDRLVDNAVMYQKSNQHKKTKRTMIEAKSQMEKQFKINCGNGTKHKRLLKDLKSAINIYTKKGY